MVTSRVPPSPSSRVNISPTAYGSSLVPSPSPAGASVGSSVGSSVCSSVGSAVGSAVGSSVGSAVGSSVESSVSVAVVSPPLRGSSLSRVNRKMPPPTMISSRASTAQPAQIRIGTLFDFFGTAPCGA
ncbi:MAG: glycine zipper domain-containing protein [Brachybacterium sp.]